MPTHRQRAALASSETRSLFAEIPSRADSNPTSYQFQSTTPLLVIPLEVRAGLKELRTAIMDGDPFNIAVDWQNYSFTRGKTGPAGHRAPPVYFRKFLDNDGKPTQRILVLNTANERKPGGDWDGGVLGITGEESLARRSNLVQTLTTTSPHNSSESYYPIPETGGIYSPNTVVFRSGHGKDYAIWPEHEWTTISVVSVAAVRRPKTDENGTRYSFEEERELQREKMKTILRIAAMHGHVNLVLGGFGSCAPGAADSDASSSPITSQTSTLVSGGSSAYKNPVKDVCKLWHELLYETDEFQGYFENVVFAIGAEDAGAQREFRKYFG